MEQRDEPGGLVVELDMSDASEGDYLNASSTKGFNEFDSHAWKDEPRGMRDNAVVVVAVRHSQS